MNGAVDEGEDAAIEVVFLADGHISCTQLDEELASKNKAAVKKPRWRVRPGPAHLDTCEFEFDVAGAGRVAFCGYVDRGQRIESRFSRRPIRVSGFAFEKRDAADASNTADDSRPSGRFAMSGPVDVRSSKWF